MAGNPQQIANDTNTLIKAWETLAPDASFGGMTLTQFKAAVKPSFDQRDIIDTLNNQMTAALDNRDDADAVTLAASQKVVKGVVGDPNYGDDSHLYEAMGYVHKSERATGLARKKPAPAAPAK